MNALPDRTRLRLVRRGAARVWLDVALHCCAAGLLGLGLLGLPLRGSAADEGKPDVIAEMIRDLHDPSSRVRENAAITLNNRGEIARRAVPELLAALPKERDADVRHFMAHAVGVIAAGMPEAVPPLVQSAKEDRAAKVRSAAVWAIGRLGLQPELAIPALLAALHDEESEVRAAAAEALANKAFASFASRIALPLASAFDDPDDQTSYQASVTLQGLGAAALPALPAMRRMLRETDKRRRLLAVRVVASIGMAAAAAAPECLAVIDNISDNISAGISDPELPVETGIALLSIGQAEPRAMSTLVKALSFPAAGSLNEEDLRRAVLVRASWGIGNFASHAPAAAAPRLASLIDDSDEDVREFAGKALDKVVAALAAGHRSDALAGLKQARVILLTPGHEKSSMKIALLDEAISAVEAQQPWTATMTKARAMAAAGAALAALALGGVYWWRHRRQPQAIEGATPRILLSYRRADSAALCGRVYDRLVSRFGTADVFRDVDSLAPGELFGQRIRECIQSCDAVIVLMGRRWTGEAQAGEPRRIDNPADFVRMEVAEAIAQGKRLIPLLHDGAQMPARESLPADIAAITERNAIELTDRHFDADIASLMKTLSQAATGSNAEVASMAADAVRADGDQT